MSKVRIGVDLGGTKIEALAIGEDGAELLRRRVATPVGDYEGTVLAVTNLILGMESEIGERGSVGIGTPGTPSLATGLMRNANSVCLIGKPLHGDLEAALDRPVKLENDANCFALSEATDGAGKGANVVFGVILGTGVGGGIVVHGHALAGVNSIAGEWGHNPLPLPEGLDLPFPSCYCGRKGCVEQYLCGPGLAADHERVTGQTLKSADIAKNADAGDADCEATMQRYERRLAKSLSYVVNILDPDVIVLGGGVSNIDRLYQNVPKIWGEYIFSDTVETRLAKNVHGDSSGVRGAAWLWE